MIPRGVNARILIRALLDDGFSEARVEGSHHRFKRPDGRAVTVAYSRQNDTFTIGTLRRMIDDLGRAETLNLEKNPFSLAKGQRWTLRYSLAVLSTPADHARLAEIVAAFKSKNS